MILGTISAVYNLGVYNVVQASIYKFLLRTNYFYSEQKLKRNIVLDDIKVIVQSCKLTLPLNKETNDRILLNADHLLNGDITYFGSVQKNNSVPPKWFYDPFNNCEYAQKNKLWFKIREFSRSSNDIKIIWDISRFSWYLDFMTAYKLTGNEKYFHAMNDWFVSWLKDNTPYLGPNYKCAQEVSLRVLNIIMSLLVADSLERIPEGIRDFFVISLDRISRTLFYAKAQRNNHIISESIALYLCSSILLKEGKCNLKTIKKLKRFQRLGLKLLDKSINSLIFADGGFSQGSVTYHRMVVDLVSISELVRKRISLKPFSSTFYEKARSSIDWLFDIVCHENGRPSNIGANDGTCLFNLNRADYDDYRSTLQLASILFHKERIFDYGPWDDRCSLLGVDVPSLCKAKRISHGDIYHESGFAILISDLKTKCILRYPNFKFRPLQSDLLHFDLWHKGKNILCDTGTYSYKATGSQDYQSVLSHNTVCIDGQEQMLKLSRFLYSGWPKVTSKPEIQLIPSNGIKTKAVFVNHKGASHSREVHCKENTVVIIDEIYGVKEKVEINWHLGDFESSCSIIKNNVLSSDVVNISVIAEIGNISHFNLDISFISKTYMQEEEIAVLKVGINKSTLDKVKAITKIELLE
jgi:hypothetical protein